MASSKSANRRSPKTSAKPAAPTYQDEADLPEDAMAYEAHEYETDEAGYMTQANESVREMTRGREGRVVVAALAGGFAIGAVIGCVIATSRRREPSWSDRLACEGLGRSLLDRLASIMPEGISEKLGR